MAARATTRTVMASCRHVADHVMAVRTLESTNGHQAMLRVPGMVLAGENDKVAEQRFLRVPGMIVTSEAEKFSDHLQFVDELKRMALKNTSGDHMLSGTITQ